MPRPRGPRLLELPKEDDAVGWEKRRGGLDRLAQRRPLPPGPRLRAHRRARLLQRRAHLRRARVDEEYLYAYGLGGAARGETELTSRIENIRVECRAHDDHWRLSIARINTERSTQLLHPCRQAE